MHVTMDHERNARGVDLIERTDASGTVVGFPLYHAHGNNVATLTRSGTGYAVNDRRSYDAWGVVRAQQSGGDPTLRYCGSLGHKQDDESGMVYMRARYYEPTSGRFLSEDPGCAGHNLYAYCGNDPVNAGDPTGCADLAEVNFASAGMAGLRGGFIGGFINWLKGGSFLEGFAAGFITGGVGSCGVQIGGAAAYVIPMMTNAIVNAVRAVMTNKSPGNIFGKVLVGLAMGSLTGYLANSDVDFLNGYEAGAAGVAGNQIGSLLVDAATGEG